jgi:hypothetical protein
MGCGAHNFAPFKDLNPDCKTDERYKALASGDTYGGLYPFKSPDRIHWSLMRSQTFSQLPRESAVTWKRRRSVFVQVPLAETCNSSQPVRGEHVDRLIGKMRDELSGTTRGN